MAMRKITDTFKSKYPRKPKFVKTRSEKWRDEFYVTAFRLARQGYSDTQIAKAVGVFKLTFYKWRDGNPALKAALDSARSLDAGAGNLGEYVHGRLPPRLQKLWAEIEAVDECKDDSVAARRRRVERMLDGTGRVMRQKLWLHALVTSNFNKFDACRKTNVSWGQVKKWIYSKKDQTFHELLDSIVEMKKDFVDGCLMGLIKQGDSPATIFAAKTLLRDRGYNPSVHLEVNKTVKNVNIDMDKVLDKMSVEGRKELLKALETQRGETKALPPRVVETEAFDGEVSDE